jgi:UPF0755 protein
VTPRGRESARLTDHRRHRGPVMLGFVVILVVIALLGVWGWNHFVGNKSSGNALAGGPRTVVVPEGATADQVAHLLEEARVISSATAFLVRLKVAGGAETIKPGSYTFQSGEQFDAIVARLKQGGVPLTTRVAIPEGLSIGQTARRVAEESSVPASSYVALAHQTTRFSVPKLKGQPAHPKDFEGYLFPSTYELGPKEGGEQLIEQQLRTFDTKTASVPWDNAKTLGITPYQALIVASLIEKEARVPEERVKIAAVIYNRLRRNMSLGIDATVRFALDKWTGSLTKSDLDVDSPYNTRKRKGLPPGPIASPGLAALRAALNPAKVDSLYYVLVDQQGHHFFTASYVDFLKAQAKIPASSR